MELILIKDVEKLGYADDVVKVRSGFGLNYLIPQGFAVIKNQGTTFELNNRHHLNINYYETYTSQITDCYSVYRIQTRNTCRQF